MVCVDTTFLVDLIRKKSAALNVFRKLLKQRAFFSTTIISIAELYHGAYRAANVNKKTKEVENIENTFNVLKLDEQSAKKYGELASFLEKKGESLDPRDIFIGAISICNGEKTLITRNKKHFSKIPGISVTSY